MYNPAQPVGQRWSGLLADSTFDRLYHSEAYLTTNADVGPCSLFSGFLILFVFVEGIYLCPCVLKLGARASCITAPSRSEASPPAGFSLFSVHLVCWSWKPENLVSWRSVLTLRGLPHHHC